MIRHRARLAAVCGGLVLIGISSPVQALERLVLRMPFLETSVTINLAEAGTAAELVQSSPDLADLQSASGGKLLDLIGKVFLAPLPVETKAFLEGSTGQPLLEQALFAATHIVDLEGVKTDTSGRMLTDALVRAERKVQPNVLGFLRELPGQQASIDLSKLAVAANRLKANQEQGVALVKAWPAATVMPSLRTELKPSWTRQVARVAVPHRL